MGVAPGATFGSAHTHIFANHVPLIADPEEILLGPGAEAIPLISALVGGIGGKAQAVYGGVTNATYIGPITDIRRAKSIAKTTNYVLARKADPMQSGSNFKSDEIDMAMCVAVGALSLLIVLVPAVLELVVRFKYPTYGKSEAGQAKTPEILKTCAIMITSRLMALLKLIETKGSELQWGQRLLLEGIGLLAAVPYILMLPFLPILMLNHRTRELVELEMKVLESLSEMLAV
jgi:hypothetical protein